MEELVRAERVGVVFVVDDGVVPAIFICIPKESHSVGCVDTRVFIGNKGGVDVIDDVELFDNGEIDVVDGVDDAEEEGSLVTVGDVVSFVVEVVVIASALVVVSTTRSVPVAVSVSVAVTVVVVSCLLFNVTCGLYG